MALYGRRRVGKTYLIIAYFNYIFDFLISGKTNVNTSQDTKNKNTIYRLSDYYTLFYFRFLKNDKNNTENAGVKLTDNPMQRARQGFTYEQVCLDHVWQIKKTLGISGIQSNNASWRGGIETKSVQIDLLIDRGGQVINLCECKFSLYTFSIDKSYAEQ